MKVTRRTFFQGLLAVGAVSAVRLPMYPVLYADGVNDDAPAINAAMRGLPITVEGETFRRPFEELFHLQGANIAIGSPIVTVPDREFVLNNLHITALREMDCMFDMRKGAVYLADSMLDGRGMLRTSAIIANSTDLTLSDLHFRGETNSFRLEVPK